MQGLNGQPLAMSFRLLQSTRLSDATSRRKVHTVTTIMASILTERRMVPYRVSIRQAIRTRLGQNSRARGKGPPARASAARKQPMLRFNADEGYRIAYQVDSQTRRVVVLILRF